MKKMKRLWLKYLTVASRLFRRHFSSAAALLDLVFPLLATRHALEPKCHALRRVTAEEHSLTVRTLRTELVFRSRQRRIGAHVVEDDGLLAGVVREYVTVDAVIFRRLGVVDQARAPQQLLVRAVLTRQEYVVGLRAEAEAQRGLGRAWRDRRSSRRRHRDKLPM